MKSNAQGKRLIYLFVLLAFFSFALSGCSKQRAKLALNKAEKLIREAKDNNAEQNTKELYQQATEAISGAHNSLNGGDAKTALSQAKSAVDLSKRTLNEAKQKNAIELESKAKEDIQIADKNFGQKENPEIYKKIRETYTQGEEKRKKEKYDQAVKLYRQVISDVDTLLSRLQNEAKRRQDEARLKLSEMQKVGVRDYTPNYYVELTELLDEIEKLIKEQRDYVSAINRSEMAVRKAEEGIEKTKQKQSQEKIRFIETNLATAMTKGAPLYAPDLLEKCNENFDLMLKDYQDRKYDKILQVSDSITSQVTELVFQSKKGSANDKIVTVQKKISDLVEGGAKEYLPGRVEKMEEMLIKAQGKFAENVEPAFEEVEQICLMAVDEDEKILADFDALASVAINAAGESLEVTKSVFDKMSYIFMEKTPGSFMESVDTQFENGKEAFKEELKAYLDNANLSIERALNKRQEQDYKTSIEIANNEVKKVAEEVLSQTYHVVAHNAMMELSSSISRYEQDGAREYVPVELDRTKTLLEATKSLVREAQYKAAVSKASEARAQLDLTVQELVKKAVSDIEKAKKTLADSKNYEVDKYKPEDIKKSETLLEEARTYLANRQIKKAVESADESSKSTGVAVSAASEMWAEESIKTSEIKIKRAEEAGAIQYSGSVLEDSKSQIVKAKELFKQGYTNPESFVKAKDAAILAGEKADKALYYKVETAESSINTAKNVGGWKYNPAELSNAIQKAKDSRDAIERKEYLISAQYADTAKLIADRVIIYSKDASFKERVALIKNTLDTGYKSGIKYFQPKETKEITDKVAELEKKYRIEDFEYISNELSKIEGKLAALIQDTPEVYYSLVSKEKSRLEMLNTEFNAKTFAPKAVENARTYIRYSEVDFKNKKFTEAYKNLGEAISNIDSIELRYNEEIYANKVESTFKLMQTSIDDLYPLLNLNPNILYKIAKTYDGSESVKSVAVSGRITPQEYTEKIEELYNQTAEITPPPTKEIFHKDVLVAINNARLAGVYFEKLIILDEFKKDSAKQLIDKAFKFIDDAKKQQDRLQKELTAQAEKSRSLKVEDLPGWASK